MGQRKVEEYESKGAKGELDIFATDEPGHGGAHHRYRIAGADGATVAVISFQNGTIPEVGVNGVTMESLLAVAADRLVGFQTGEFKCEENEYALYHIRQAIHWLHVRTAKRLARGVEGTHQK